MWSRKTMLISLTVGLIKKILLYKMNYFPKLSSHSKNKIKVQLVLSDYATKSDFKKCNRHWYIKIC